MGASFCVSCSKNKNDNQPVISQSTELNDSIGSTVEKKLTNKAKGLSYVKIFMLPEDQYKPTQKSGIIIKLQNETCTGCLFTYNPKHNLKEICEFQNCRLIGSTLEFNYKQVTLNYFETGDYNYFVGYAEVYEQFLSFKKQDVTKSPEMKKWDDIEGFSEYNKEEQLPDDIINNMPELLKFTTLETYEINQSLPSYSEVRGTLIQETNVSTIKEILGEPDDIFDYNQLEWDVYYFAVQKNGKVGHLAIRINGLHPRTIDEVTFYNPGDRIKLFNSYYISPTRPKK